MTQAYPLHWPAWKPRKPIDARKTGRFNTKRSNGSYLQSRDLTVADAMGRLQREIDAIGARNYVLSTNVELRLDGLPRSGQPEPKDPGVALYFYLQGKQLCMPCDTYTRIADNIAALAAHIEATRAIERYGVQTINEAFTGFEALPAPTHWSEILGLNRDFVTAADVDAAYRRKAKDAHPDRPGGSHDKMSQLNAARDAALKEI